MPKKVVAFECEVCGSTSSDREAVVACEASHAPAKPCPFRAVGFTAAAAAFPLSHAGQLVVAAHNGVTVDRMPEAFRFAPNAGMKLWLEALGELLLAGACVRDDDGRWWTMARLEAAYGPL
jgi:hypothetical protein